MALGDSVKNTLIESATATAELLTAPITAAIQAGLTNIIKTASPELAAKLSEGLQAVLNLPVEERSSPYSGSLLATYRMLGVLASITGAPMGLLPALGDIYAAGYGQHVQSIARAAFLPTRADPDTVLRAELRDPSLREFADETLEDLGYHPKVVEVLRLMRQFLPNVQDLVRFAVREVFSPEVVSKFGQLADFPADFAEQAAKQGVSSEVAQWYWAAHWELPGASQGFEMFHRGLITLEELELLLRTLDVMPFWRDKLIGIAYNPFTRVDVRRMFQAGVLDQAAVLQAYRDLGYDADKAAKLTEFTIKKYPEDAGESEIIKSDALSFYKLKLIDQARLTAALKSAGISDADIQLYISRADAQVKDEPATAAQRDLTKSELVSLYKTKLLSAEELASSLTALGYTADQIEYFVALADYQSVQALQNAWLNAYETLYVHGIVDKTAVTGKMSELGFEIPGIEDLFALWDVEKIGLQQRPTRAELIRFWQKGIIDEPRFRAEMRRDGLTDEYIDMYIADKTQ